MSEKDDTIMKALIKSTYLGLFLNTLFPAGILIFAYLHSEHPMASNGGFDLRLTESISPMFYAFLVVSLIDMLIAYFIRTKLPTRIFKIFLGGSGGNLEDSFVSAIYKTSFLMFLCTASISLCGLIMTAMGGSFEVTVLFVALTFASYQIFRPRKGYLEKLYDQLNSSVID